MEIFTIGHSNHPIEHFIGMLQQHEIDTVIDVRSIPRSRFCPQFNEGALGKSLAGVGIDHVLAGTHLGGRSLTPAQSGLFVEKMNKILEMAGGRDGSRIALMCSEGPPSECHRAGKLTRWLHVNKPDVKTTHILRDCSVIDGRQYEPYVKKDLRDLTMGPWPTKA